MKWRGLERSRNVEDRRRARPSPLVAGAGGLGLIAVLVALFLGGSSGGGSLDLEGLRQGLEAQQPAPTPLNPANL
jgi:predicted metalloprotease